MTSLPIDALISQIVGALDKGNAAVVAAEPGAGKTTRIPPALLSAAFAKDKEIWVLQPRRIAAKMAALRVAEEMGEEPGKTVGYQFRFENKTGPATRLKFMTDGMLLPLSQKDPSLSKVAAVVLDEFHERSLALDLGLAWLKRLQSTTRPDLRLLVMSATLDAQSLAAYLDNCSVFKSEGRVFPVSIEYQPYPQEPDLSLKVRSALRQLKAKGLKGTRLVFLPGLAEIKRAEAALKGEGLEVHALYGDMSVEEQHRVLSAEGDKVILSTNLAETSLTVPGVTAVVDSGLTRQSRVSTWSGLSSLVTVPASQASAAQRTGRAGRLQAGVCLRLYTQFDFDHRAAFDLPEISRADLSKSLLDLLALGVTDPINLPWFQNPPAVALEAAHVLLVKLGAVTLEDDINETGRRMARLPLPPRLSRFLLEVDETAGKQNHTLHQACRLAALISEERNESEDLMEELRRYRPGFESKRLEEQLADRLGLTAPKGGKTDDSLLGKALLTAFPDRVAQVRQEDSSTTRNRSGKTRELVLSQGGMALAGDNPLTRGHRYFVVVEAQETPGGVKARSLWPIEEDWLLDLFPDELREEQTSEWNAKAGRVEGFKRLKYGQLVLDEKPLSSGEVSTEATALLLKEALSAGPQAYCDPEELKGFLDRIQFVASRERFSPPFDKGGEGGIVDEWVQETLKELCAGCRSLSDLKAAGLVSALRSKLTHQQSALLEKLAPSQVALPSGRRMLVHYETGKPPWGESRIQDFFGMKQGPTVGGGEVPVVLHLLSPAKRPVQVTSDLAGFWKNHYPQTRKELMRKYPRHKWPENPLLNG